MQSPLDDANAAVITQPAQKQPAREYLESLLLHGIKLGLSNIESLLRHGGMPQKGCPAVHVAGTNGKGSVLAFLDAILLQSGYKTGRFTSPHLLDVTERFLINGHPISNAALERYAQWCRENAELAHCVPTYFEANTAMAFHCFREEKVDAALIEAGTCGRFDSTNLIHPRLCAITNIALDHTRFLGDSLAEIAFEKAGILKEGVPVVTGKMDPVALAVIEEEAREKGVKLYREGIEYVAKADGTPWTPWLHYEGLGLRLEGISLGLAGMHQIENAGIAVTLAGLLREEYSKITEQSIRKGLEKALWPGRLERILEDPPVLMDVAHNPAGCTVLTKAIDPCVVVFAVSSDKDARTMLSLLKPLARPLILSSYSGERSLSLKELSVCADTEHCLIIRSLPEALERGRQEASSDKALLITGSIYACGEARNYLMKQWGVSAPAYYRP